MEINSKIIHSILILFNNQEKIINANKLDNAFLWDRFILLKILENVLSY